GCRHDADGAGSTVGRGYHLHPAGTGVRLLGGDSGRLLAARGGLGAGAHAGRRVDASGAAYGAGGAAARAGAGASLRPRRAVRLARLYGAAPGARGSREHVAQGKSVRQRDLRVVPENAEVRGSAPQRISRSGRGAGTHRGVPGDGVQRTAAALGAGLPVAGAVRERVAGRGAAHRGVVADGRTSSGGGGMSFPRHGKIYRPIRWSGNRPEWSSRRPDRSERDRLDEFSAGYSSAGCAPAEPTSASPAGAHLAAGTVRRTIKSQRTANRGLTACLSFGVHPSMCLFYTHLPLARQCQGCSRSKVSGIRPVRTWVPPPPPPGVCNRQKTLEIDRSG